MPWKNSCIGSKMKDSCLLEQPLASVDVSPDPRQMEHGLLPCGTPAISAPGSLCQVRPALATGQESKPLVPMRRAGNRNSCAGSRVKNAKGCHFSLQRWRNRRARGVMLRIDCSVTSEWYQSQVSQGAAWQWWSHATEWGYF